MSSLLFRIDLLHRHGYYSSSSFSSWQAMQPLRRIGVSAPRKKEIFSASSIYSSEINNSSSLSLSKEEKEGLNQSHSHSHGSVLLSKEEEQQLLQQNQAFTGRKLLFTASIVAAWYFSNISVLLLNKYLLSNYGFKFPIFLTMCHMASCALLSYVAVVSLKIVPLQFITSQGQFLKICALSVVFCSSVVGGNISLRYLPISFNQAVGATAPLFTAAFAYIATSRQESFLAYASLVPVVAGLVIASGGEPSFHHYGFIICACATAGRAFKSVLQGILLSSEGEKLNSMNLLLYMAPIAMLVLLPISLVVEPNVLGTTVALARKDPFIVLYIAVNSAMAYFVNLTNFLVTKHTSPLTLQVLGNAKGVVAVIVSILVFHNPVSVTGMLGYMLSVCGVILYGKAKQLSK